MDCYMTRHQNGRADRSFTCYLHRTFSGVLLTLSPGDQPGPYVELQRGKSSPATRPLSHAELPIFATVDLGHPPLSG